MITIRYESLYTVSIVCDYLSKKVPKFNGTTIVFSRSMNSFSSGTTTRSYSSDCVIYVQAVRLRPVLIERRTRTHPHDCLERCPLDNHDPIPLACGGTQLLQKRIGRLVYVHLRAIRFDMRQSTVIRRPVTNDTRRLSVSTIMNVPAHI